MAPLCVCWLPLSSLIITSIYLCLLNQHFKIVTGKMAIYFLMVIFWLFTDFFFFKFNFVGYISFELVSIILRNRLCSSFNI